MIENECTKECSMSGKFPWFPGKLALKLIDVADVTSCCWPMQSLSSDFKEMNTRAIKYLHVHAMHGFVLLVFLFVV